MIFVTVGTQLAFPRLIGAVSALPDHLLKQHELIVQSGPGRQTMPMAKEVFEFVEPPRAQQLLASATLVIGHAGMGTILTCLELGCPVVVLPRRADLGEHRNDHQMATCKRLSGRRGVFVAWTAEELEGAVREALAYRASETISSTASPELMARVRAFVLGDDVERSR